MSAIESNIVNTNRHKLEDVIPLSTPYSLAIDPSNLCNFKCKFCAMQASKEKQNYKKQCMELSLFKKIIDDINGFPDKLKVLRLSAQGEPLLNKDLPEMIRYAKKKEVAEYIEIVTNGSRLNPILNQELIDSGVDRIRISIEAVDEEGYLEIAGVKIDLQNFIRNIKDLHIRSGEKCEIYIKIVDAAVKEPHQKEKFKAEFSGICDRIWIDNIIPLWSDFEELTQNFDILNDKGVHGQKIQKVEICPFSFYNLIINPDGQVTVCCADWKRKLVVGDLKIESMMNVWNGDKLRNFWVDMLNGNRKKYEMCRKCLLPSYDCNDNIDAYAEQILSRIQKEK
ncbi:MAG: radical SAM protein [Lachnospiraceae bacterium]|nr:radical SAM protein [Lachnospiraceae bacterium]